MAQYHHVVFYDTATEQWYVDPQTDAYFQDGEVWDYAGDHMWQRVPEGEGSAYQDQITHIISTLNADKWSEMTT
jgi:hypothetical protein